MTLKSLTFIFIYDIIKKNQPFMDHLQVNTEFSFKKVLERIKECVRTIRKVNSLLRTIDRGIVNLSWISSAFNGLKFLFGFAAVGVLAQTAVTSLVSSGHFSRGYLMLAVALFATYGFTKELLNSYSHYRTFMFKERADILLDEKMLDKSISLDIGKLMEPAFNELHRLAFHGKRSVMQIFDLQNGMIGSVCSVIVSLGVAYAINPLLALFTFLSAVPRVIQIFIYQNLNREARKANDLVRRQQGEYLRYLESPSSLVQSKLLKHVTHMFDMYKGCFREILERDASLEKKETVAVMFANFVQTAVFSAILFYLGKNCLEGSLSLGKVIVSMGGILSFHSAITEFSQKASTFNTAQKDYEGLESYLALVPLVDESAAANVAFEDTPDIVFEGMHFVYPSNIETEVLSDCSLIIPGGQNIALVGENGAGKSTLIKLLSKFYLPTEGGLTIGEHAVETITQKSLLDALVCCTQDSALAELVIKESITGSLDPDMERLRLAASLSRADVFINKLEKGYDTRIGGRWNGGKELSGGQMQRLKLAAVFYRLLEPRVKIGIFDEPMSHCDIQTKNSFYEAITSFAAFSGKTIIVIVHDHVYLDRFDRVIEIQNSTIAQDLNYPMAIRDYQDMMLGTNVQQPIFVECRH